MQELEFMKLFNELCIAYGKEFGRERALVYFKYLGGLDVEDFRKAVERYIDGGSEYFPTVSQLKEIINPPDVGASWENVVKVAEGGCREWKKLTDVEIAVVSAVGGMGIIQNGTEQSLRFVFNDFQKAFPVISKQENTFNSDGQRLKTLNVCPETFKFLYKKVQPELLPDNEFGKIIATLAKKMEVV